MTYREYFEAHEDENLSWCKPYANKDEDCFAIMHDGTIERVGTPEMEAQRYDGSLNDETLEAFARRVNPDYNLYSGWSDEHIILEAMHECGCANCPFIDDCEAMGEEIQETDYR